MQLSRRLATLAQHVPRNSVVADIGTDHAYLPVYLVRAGICPRAVASDLNSGPIESARQTVCSYGLEEKIDIRQGDGLEILKPGEVDVVILAGMGGKLIARILEKGPEVLKSVSRLVLQPNNNAGVLRSWLVENNWGIVDEQLIQENRKLYPLIVSVRGRGSFPKDHFSFEIGPCLLQKGGLPLKKLLEQKNKEYLHILEGLSRSSDPKAAEKEKKIRELIKKVREALCNVRKS